MMVVGVWFKGGDYGQVINVYCQVCSVVQIVCSQGYVVVLELVMQSWFGEVGCWFVVNNLGQVMQGYLQVVMVVVSILYFMFQFEGQCMVGYCLFQQGKCEEVCIQLLEVICIVMLFLLQDCYVIILLQVLWDLLQLQDLCCCEWLQDIVCIYLEQIIVLYGQVEDVVVCFGMQLV